jgi:hypothetical protein
MRFLVCVILAYGLALQMLLTAMSGSMHLSAQASGLEGLKVICTAGGMSSPDSGEKSDHHTGVKCCAWGSTASDATLLPQTPRLCVTAWPRVPTIVSGWAEPHVVARGPPMALAPLQPRAPPRFS